MRAVGLVAVQALGRFPQPNAAEKPSRGGKMADHHLIHPGPGPFRRTGLGLFPACRRYAVSGGRFRGRLQHLGFYPTVVTAAASPDADCNCLLKVQMPAFGLRTPSVRGRGICGKHADDLPFPRAADIQLLENRPVLGHDDKALNLQSRKSM